MLNTKAELADGRFRAPLSLVWPARLPTPQFRASEIPHSLVLSLQDIPGHGQQGQEAGMAHVLDLLKSLLVLGPRHVVLELLQQKGAREGHEAGAPEWRSGQGPGRRPPTWLHGHPTTGARPFLLQPCVGQTRLVN